MLIQPSRETTQPVLMHVMSISPPIPEGVIKVPCQAMYQ